jgi:hypothetical protein
MHQRLLNEQPHRVVVVRLSLEGLVLVVVLALLLWGILTFGSKGVATERQSLSALIAPAPSIAGSAAPQASRKEAAMGDVSKCVEDSRCLAKEWPHTTTTRQPGGGGGERAR